jgi:hypothetical protein
MLDSVMAPPALNVQHTFFCCFSVLHVQVHDVVELMSALAIVCLQERHGTSHCGVHDRWKCSIPRLGKHGHQDGHEVVLSQVGQQLEQGMADSVRRSHSLCRGNSQTGSRSKGGVTQQG